MKVYYKSKLAKMLTFMPGFSTMMFCGVVITEREGLSERVLAHEGTHIRQYWDLTGMGLGLSILILFTLFAFEVESWWMLTLLAVPFTLYYVVYGVEWLVSIIHWFFSKKKKDIVEANGKAYRNSAMEMEARFNERVKDYLLKRRPFAFIKYYGLI